MSTPPQPTLAELEAREREMIAVQDAEFGWVVQGLAFKTELAAIRAQIAARREEANREWQANRPDECDPFHDPIGHLKP